MRRPHLFPVAILLAVLASAIVVPAQADGIIIPDPPICHPAPCPEPVPIAQLAIEYHRVQVTIEDQVAVTRVDQAFRNDNDWPVEGTYIFPLPAGASVTSFTLWVNGEPVEGKVLTREEARQTYEEIVRTLRDPALLEYVDRGAVQASIFPIAPGETRRIQLEYTQVLSADSGLIHYIYPLSTEKYSREPLEEVSISVSVHSAQPVRAIYSPSHKVAVNREGDHDFSAGYEDSNVLPDRDFELFYSVDARSVGLQLLSYRQPEGEDDDGFFLLLAAPSVEIDPEDAIAKDVLFVLDQSGSMDGEKLRQAQQALQYILDHLNPADRFNIIAFSTGVRLYADGLQPVAEADEASKWVDTLSALGSTDINRALLEAASMADQERPTMLIFLTDGLPTEGVTETQDILDNLGEAAPSNVRLFAFGVGYDVDTFLLDSLAQLHHGYASYVAPDQALDEVVSGFFAKVSNPVLTDLELDLGDVGPYDLQPGTLPDLFVGSQLVLVGRYRHPGTVDITLSGSVAGRMEDFTYDEQEFVRQGGPEFLPRLWATRKIGALLNQVRLEGANRELVDQIVKLSIRYGIVTPYTSYLVTEPQVFGAEAQEGVVDQAFQDLMAQPPIFTGQAAVERAAAESAIGGSDIASAPEGEGAELVRVVGNRTFRLVDGVWIDTGFDPQNMTTTRVSFLSDDYFALAGASQALSGAFALGSRVIALWDGVAYEVVASDQPGDEIDIQALPTDEPETSAAGTPAPTEASGSGEEGAPRSLCLGAALPLALIAIPLRRRMRKA